MSPGPGMGWWERGLDRGEAMLRNQGGLLVLGVVASLVALVILPAGDGGIENTDAAVTLFLLEIAVLAAFLSSGTVSSEVRRGTSLLWIQKGGAAELHYLRRGGESLVLACLSGFAVLVLQALVLSLLGGDPVLFLASAAPAVPAVVAIVGAATFALSCAGLQGEGLGALVLLSAWLAVPALLPSGGVSGLLARVLEATSPPVGILQGLRAWGLGTGAPSLAEGAHLVAWMMGMGLAGSFMLSWHLRSPLAPEQSR